MKTIMRVYGTLALVAVLGTATANAAGGTGISHCQIVANGVQDELSTCWFFANSEQDAQRKQRLSQRCNRMVSVGNQLIQWCNSNINKCKQKRVSYDFDVDVLFHFGPKWSIGCTYR